MKDQENNPTEYHYDLQQENRAIVRAQATAINRSLKQLKKISNPYIPVPIRDDEPTDQHVTVPNGEKADLRLKQALEDAAEQCRKSEKPPPNDTPTIPKRKRWFGWRD